MILYLIYKSSEESVEWVSLFLKSTVMPAQTYFTRHTRLKFCDYWIQKIGTLNLTYACTVGYEVQKLLRLLPAAYDTVEYSRVRTCMFLSVVRYPFTVRRFLDVAADMTSTPRLHQYACNSHIPCSNKFYIKQFQPCSELFSSSPCALSLLRLSPLLRATLSVSCELGLRYSCIVITSSRLTFLCFPNMNWWTASSSSSLTWLNSNWKSNPLIKHCFNYLLRVFFFDS